MSLGLKVYGNSLDPPPLSVPGNNINDPIAFLGKIVANSANLTSNFMPFGQHDSYTLEKQLTDLLFLYFVWPHYAFFLQ